MGDSVGIRALLPVVEAWLAGWRALDAEALARLCDFAADFCFQPMATARPLQDAEALHRYVAAARQKALQVVDFALTDLACETHGDMLSAWAVCYFRALVPGEQEPRAAPVRVTFVARRRDDGWKLVCVHHSTQQRSGLPESAEPAEAGPAGDPQAKAIAREIAETFTAGWAALDLATVWSPWDASHDRLLYMAFEGPHALRTWQGMQQYAVRLRQNGLASGTRFRWRPLSDDDVSAGMSGDFLWAHCLRDYTVFRPEEPQTRLAGHPYRETWLAHRVDGAWKAFHYHESVRAQALLPGPFVADWWPD
ncbi:MAG: nuclear transport factor 2 family protein [Dehalococcoidia bacterium]|nr:nuclear transport factor 2 family protein [Dehalococcoidia bacterium]